MLYWFLNNDWWFRFLYIIDNSWSSLFFLVDYFSGGIWLPWFVLTVIYYRERSSVWGLWGLHFMVIHRSKCIIGRLLMLVWYFCGWDCIEMFRNIWIDCLGIRRGRIVFIDGWGCLLCSRWVDFWLITDSFMVGCHSYCYINYDFNKEKDPI